MLVMTMGLWAHFYPHVLIYPPNVLTQYSAHTGAHARLPRETREARRYAVLSLHFIL